MSDGLLHRVHTNQGPVIMYSWVLSSCNQLVLLYILDASRSRMHLFVSWILLMILYLGFCFRRKKKQTKETFIIPFEPHSRPRQA